MIVQINRKTNVWACISHERAVNMNTQRILKGSGNLLLAGHKRNAIAKKYKGTDRQYAV